MTVVVETGQPVEAHPHRPKVLNGEARCISTRPRRFGARTEYLSMLVMEDVEFRYQRSGQKRVEAEKRRNVHAWARGTVLTHSIEQVIEPVRPEMFGWVKVTYNPFKRDHFYRVDLVTDDYGTQVAVPGPEVVSARFVWMVGGNCFAWNPVYAEERAA